MGNKPPKTILFVCTGNTCRSPMAAAVAEHLITLAGAPLRHVHALSAGAAAPDGAPMTPEAAQALSRIGIDAPAHRSSPLTAELTSRADIIYVMTDRHAQAVISVDPESQNKIKTLDPSGEEVPDPIGMPQSVYDQTVARLKTLIQRRLEEMK